MRAGQEERFSVGNGCFMLLTRKPGAESRLRKKLDQIWPVLERTGVFPDASKDRLVFL